MKLTTKLAYSQLMQKRKRTIWTLLGIVLSTAMITAVFGFAASGLDAITEVMGDMVVRDNYYYTIYSIGVILSLIIVAVSVIVVSNAFRVSAGERLAQFGILKSVGATKRQIAATVVREGVLLSVIGVPLGIAAGLLVQLIGVGIANQIIAGLNNALDNSDLLFSFVFAWQGVLISVGLSFFTVLLSAWLPARKAAKVPAINAIRGVDEVKLKAKQVRSNWFVRKLFGFEGELASKSLKRSKRNMRATVVSLTVSIVLFIAASSFGSQLFRMTNLVFAVMDADVLASFSSSRHTIFGDDGEILEERFVSMNTEEAENITAIMRQFPETSVFGVGGNSLSYFVPQETLQYTPAFVRYLNQSSWLLDINDIYVPVTLLTVDAENYAELARRAGVPLGSNILINHVRTQASGNWEEFAPLVFTGQGLSIQNLDGDIIYLPLHGELRGLDVPNEIVNASRFYVNIIVPEVDAHFYFWAAQTSDPHGFTEYTRDFLWDMLPQYDDIGANAHVFNAVAEDDAMRSLFHLIMTAVYGFVGMLTLIGLTNVISTISTNVRSRSREFAVLQSVGMTHGGLRNMLNLESIFASVKSLFYGLPLGIGASYLIYLGIMESVRFEFEFPWLAVIQCVVAVFAITWVTMRFAVSRLKSGSIVESIRG